MKFIKKNYTDLIPPEPTAFMAWKTQEHERLQHFYSQNNAADAWNHLPAKQPDIHDDNIAYYSGSDLKKELLTEQGFICAYCNRRIHQEENRFADDEKAQDHNDRRCSIEHVSAKTEDPANNTFNYSNLVAVCRGGERIPKPRQIHCDNARGSKPLPINPLQEDCEKHINYKFDGAIETEYCTPSVREIVETLGLNIRKLVIDRESSIKGTVMTDDMTEFIDKEKAQKLLIKLNTLKEGKYEEYCSAIISFIKNNLI
jgi:uncharacterized protein (TIGR02646 family)